MNAAFRASAWTFLVVPWVYPFASGPSSSIEPWLVTLCVTGLLIALIRMDADLLRNMPSLIASAWVWAAVIGAVMGLMQYLGLAAHVSPWVPASQAGNAYGALRQRNQFATLTLIGLIALLPSVRRGARWRHVAPAVLILVAGNAVSASRTGALGLVLLCAVSLVWPRYRDRRVVLCLLLGLVGYVIAAFAMPVFLSHWQGVQAPSVFDRIASSQGCGSRTVLWANVVHLITLKPWMGWGLGELDYAHYATLYPGPRFCDILDNAHMLPLHLAVELGVPVAAAAMLALVGLVVASAPWREAQPFRQMAWMALAVIFLHSLVEYPLWYGPFSLAAVACVAILCQSTGFRPRSNRTGKAATALMMSSLALALPGVAMLIGWDYWRVSQIYLPHEKRSPDYRQDPLSGARRTWFFRDQADFAELTTTALTRDNAAHVADLARRLLHYSPEPRVIKPLIESLTLLGQDQEALMHLARFRAAFPSEYADWQIAQGITARQPASATSR